VSAITRCRHVSWRSIRNGGDTISSLCTAITSFFARTPTRSFTSSKGKRIRQARQANYKKTRGRHKSRPHFLNQPPPVILISERVLVLKRAILAQRRTET